MRKTLLSYFFIFLSVTAQCQLLSWSPDFITETSSAITITVDGAKGNQGLLGYNPLDVYVHIGVITNKSSGAGDWKHVSSVWGTKDADFKAVPAAGQSRWTFTIPQNIRSYFNISDATEQVQKITILFRNGDGTKKQTNADGSDMYIPVYGAEPAVRITQPWFQPTFIPQPEVITKSVGDQILVSAVANHPSSLKIFLNGNVIQTASGSVTISASAEITAPGKQEIVAQATDGQMDSRDTLVFFASGNVDVAPLPEGAKPGINYTSSTSATLVLYAPRKSRVSVIGDLPGSNWTEQPAYQMKLTPDKDYWWISLTGLEAGKEYSFQYLVDGKLRIADPYAQKILDPYNDSYISNATYPNLKPYPVGSTTEVVSILQTGSPQYTWSGKSYTRPDKRNLIIYELLVRDFVQNHDWNTLRDTLNYFKQLGINAIEIMPFNEFEGNISWGYNPDFYFAPDKYYGPENTLKEFIDSCHANGIAVIMDIALNHSFGMSPMVRLYWDAAKNRPAADNPWFNPMAKHAFNVGYDMNHESAQTKYFVGRVLSHWLQEYKIDGFRFDLSKGFTQKQTCDSNGENCNVEAWSAYDQSRIDIWKGYYDSLQKYSADSYCILEHFADNSEEKVLSAYGMMLWGNANYSYNQATMGWNTDWNFDWGLAEKRGWSAPHLVTYMESHDEERLMYKNLQYGNANAGYNIKVLDTALQRQALGAAFFLTLPGPKMIWQFGEVGYDFSINHCQDNTNNESCRTDPKPIRWDYYQDARRKKLFSVYNSLIQLRKNPSFVPAFTSNSADYDFSGAFKWLKLASENGKLVVVGNFDIVAQTGSVAFPEAGLWYDYLNGTTVTATGAPQTFALKAGEFHIFTNVFVSPVAELKNFTAVNQGNSNALTWQVSDDANITVYKIQRSKDGANFDILDKVSAKGEQRYQFNDPNIAGSQVWYYRLKIWYRDGSFKYSNIVMVQGSAATEVSVTFLSNPFRDILKLRLVSPQQQTATVTVTAMDGKLVMSKSIDVSAGQNDLTLPTSALAGGIYIMRMMVKNQSFTFRIVKQN